MSAQVVELGLTKHKPTRARFTLPDAEKRKILDRISERSFQKKKFSRTKLGGERVLRKKPDVSSVPSQKSTTTPPQTTHKITFHIKRFRILPKSKREELVEMLDDVIKRLLTLINSKKTTTSVRLKAMTVLNELVSTSYRMIRDVEVEELERETEELEKEAKRTKTKDSAEEEEPANPA